MLDKHFCPSGGEVGVVGWGGVGWGGGGGGERVGSG